MRCIGLASTARGQGPAWMDQHLPGAFARLRAFGAPILQYKVCSTFDSSPTVGSIGRAIDIGSRLMSCAWSPMVVAAMMPSSAMYLVEEAWNAYPHTRTVLVSTYFDHAKFHVVS